MPNASSLEAVLAALEAACRAHPEQRVMQVVESALDAANKRQTFYVENADAVEALKSYAFPRNQLPMEDNDG